jgi:hypothetical protein
MKGKKEELKDYDKNRRRKQTKGKGMNGQTEERMEKLRKNERKRELRGRKRQIAGLMHGCENSSLNFQNCALT